MAARLAVRGSQVVAFAPKPASVAEKTRIAGTRQLANIVENANYSSFAAVRHVGFHSTAAEVSSDNGKPPDFNFPCKTKS